MQRTHFLRNSVDLIAPNDEEYSEGVVYGICEWNHYGLHLIEHDLVLELEVNLHLPLSVLECAHCSGQYSHIDVEQLLCGDRLLLEHAIYVLEVFLVVLEDNLHLPALLLRVRVLVLDVFLL